MRLDRGGAIDAPMSSADFLCSATTTYLTYLKDCLSKQADTAKIRGTMAVSQTEPVFLRFFRDSAA
jgi:hypothetical protein